MRGWPKLVTIPGPRVQILKNADPFSFSMNRTNTKVQSNSILDRTDHVSKPSGQFTCQQHYFLDVALVLPGHGQRSATGQSEQAGVRARHTCLPWMMSRCVA